MSATVACFLDGAPWYPEKRYELKDPHSQEVLYQVASVGVEGALRATRSAEEALKGEFQPPNARYRDACRDLLATRVCRHVS